MLREAVTLIGGLLFGLGCLALLLLLTSVLVGPPEPGRRGNDDARMLARLAPYNRLYGPILIALGMLIILAVRVTT